MDIGFFQFLPIVNQVAMNTRIQKKKKEFAFFFDKAVKNNYFISGLCLKIYIYTHIHMFIYICVYVKV